MLGFLAGVFAAAWLLVPTVEAQQAAPPAAKPDAPASIELTGCVSGKPAASGEFTLIDSGDGSTYRLTGKSVRKHAGKRVEIVARPPGKRLSIRGGLWPSPNVAAQASAIDPVQAAVAARSGSAGAPGATDAPLINVVRVRAVPGVCE